MSGPCTMIWDVATPQKFRTKAGSDTVLAWNDNELIGASIPTSGSRPIPELWGMFSRENRFPNTAGQINNTTDFTAFNATLSSAGQAFIGAGMFDNWPTRDITGANYRVSVTATGANAEVRISEEYSGYRSHDSLWFIANTAASSREFQPTIDGVNQGPSVVIPANSHRFIEINGSGGSSDASHGIKCVDSVAADRFDVYGSWASDYFFNATPGAGRTLLKNDGSFGSAADCLPGYSGASYDSWWGSGVVAMQIPITADEFNADEGELMIRCATPYLGATKNDPTNGFDFHVLFAMSRKDLFDAGSGFDTDNNFHVEYDYYSGPYIEGSADGSGLIESFDYATYEETDLRDSHVLALSWNRNQIGLSVDYGAWVWSDRGNYPRGWPFVIDGGATWVITPMYDENTFNYAGVTAWSRLLLFNRQLNDAERTLVADVTFEPSIEMFAVPELANIQAGSMSNWIRGDTQHIEFEIIDANGIPSDIRGCECWLTFKPGSTDEADDTDATLRGYIEIDWDGSVIDSDYLDVIDAQTGKLVFEVTESIAEMFIDLATTYRWDIQVKTANADIRTVLQGNLKLIADVTRVVTDPTP